MQVQDFPGDTVDKNLSADREDIGSIPGPGRFHMPHGRLGPGAATTETRVPKARAPQGEKPLHCS